MDHGFKLHPDGTLEITLPQGTKVGRVLVCEAGTQKGQIYYSDGLVDQYKWERDVAISQLHDLGYELGEKLRISASAEPKLEQITPSEQGESDKLGVKSGKTCTDCINHGGDWECDRTHCRKGTKQQATKASDCVNRRDAIKFLANALWSTPNELYTSFNCYENCEKVVKEAFQWLPSAKPEPSRNVVDRATMLEAYADLYDMFDSYPNICNDIHVVYDKLRNLPSAQPEFKECWVTMSNGKVKKLYYNPEYMPYPWITRHGYLVFGNKYILAYIPIEKPEPYQSESEESE